MWTRKDLKTKAKILVKQHYWWMVLVSFIMLFAGGSGAGSGGGSSAGNSAKNNSHSNGSELDFTLLLTMIAAMIVIILVVMAIAMVIRIFALNPIYVGCVEWSYSYVYEQVDPIGYEIDLIDWVDEMMEVGE